MRFGICQLKRNPEAFSQYVYEIYDGTRLVARFWHDHRCDDNGIDFIDGFSDLWPVGGIDKFLAGGGPNPLGLSDAAVVYLISKLDKKWPIQ